MPNKNEHHKPETIELIRTRVTEAHRRAREGRGDNPTMKPCTECGEWKPWSEYTIRRRKLADGSVTEYPAGRCRRCAAQKAAEHRAKLGREEMKRRDARYQRTYRAKLRRREKLPVKPIGDFLTEKIHQYGMSAVVVATGMHERQIRDMAEQTYKTVELRKVDRVLVGLNCTHLLDVLYPQEE